MKKNDLDRKRHEEEERGKCKKKIITSSWIQFRCLLSFWFFIKKKWLDLFLFNQLKKLVCDEHKKKATHFSNLYLFCSWIIYCCYSSLFGTFSLIRILFLSRFVGETQSLHRDTELDLELSAITLSARFGETSVYLD